jgi:hypothetical protein
MRHRGIDGETRGAIPDEVNSRYQEGWRRSPLGWQRIRYDYDYFDLVGGSRRGYHLHPLRVGEAAIPHAICEPVGPARAGRHYAAHEVDLLAAHEEFEAEYASGRPIGCRGLRRSTSRVGPRAARGHCGMQAVLARRANRTGG